MTLVPAFALVLLWYTPYCDRTATAGTRTVKVLKMMWLSVSPCVGLAVLPARKYR